jgi:hypothetical protein
MDGTQYPSGEFFLGSKENIGAARQIVDRRMPACNAGALIVVRTIMAWSGEHDR